jgi:hypothetical protein
VTLIRGAQSNDRIEIVDAWEQCNCRSTFEDSLHGNLQSETWPPLRAVKVSSFSPSSSHHVIGIIPCKVLPRHFITPIHGPTNDVSIVFKPTSKLLGPLLNDTAISCQYAHVGSVISTRSQPFPGIVIHQLELTNQSIEDAQTIGTTGNHQITTCRN